MQNQQKAWKQYLLHQKNKAYYSKDKNVFIRERK